jgi:hypothetical protein
VTEDAGTTAWPEPMRQLAHALLDSAVGFDPLASYETNVRAIRHVREGLLTVPVNTTVSGDGELQVSIDLAPLVFGSMMIVNLLVAHVAELAGQSREDVIAHMRQVVDDLGT